MFAEKNVYGYILTALNPAFETQGPMANGGSGHGARGHPPLHATPPAREERVTALGRGGRGRRARGNAGANIRDTGTAEQAEYWVGTRVVEMASCLNI